MKSNFKAVRIVKTYEMELCADAKTVFPLLCPSEEVDWVDGWKDVCDIIYSESGIAEEACIFQTVIPGEEKAIWFCSKYNLKGTEIEYIKHILEKAIIQWKMIVKDQSENKSSISVTYNATSLTEQGNQFVAKLMEIEFPNLMDRLEDSINYYVSTGKMKKRL